MTTRARENSTLATVAIIDTGFDLSHPLLKKLSIVDAYDYSQAIDLVSPYVQRNKSEYKGPSFDRIRMAARLQPELSSWFPGDRNSEREFQNAAFHGTSVTSLAVYDLQNVRLALYKVYPIPSEVDPDEWMADSVSKAIERAAQQGAKIINLSIGFTASIEDQNFDRWRNLRAKFDQLVASHDDILFVAAAGNENAKIDDSHILGFPCGLRRKNVICVGALDGQGRLWKPSETKGSNVVTIPDVNTVYALGENVYAAVPRHMCVDKQTLKLLFSKDEIDSAFTDRLLKQCKEHAEYAYGEATSIATPFVTNFAARIAARNPGLFGAALADHVIAKSRPIQLPGVGQVSALPFVRPSWWK